MADLTAIILTRDEEQNIATCIGRLKGIARRIVVVDSGSTDATLDTLVDDMLFYGEVFDAQDAAQAYVDAEKAKLEEVGATVTLK